MSNPYEKFVQPENPYSKFTEDENPYSQFSKPPSEKIDLSIPAISPEVSAILVRENPIGAAELGITVPKIGKDGPLGKGVWEGINEPFKPIPRVKPIDENSTVDKVLAGVGNAGIGVAESLETPLGVATLGVGALPKVIQKLVALGFGALATKGAAEKVGEATAQEPSLNPFTWSPERTDIQGLSEGLTLGAAAPFLARPTVKLGENAVLTKGDAIRVFDRDISKAPLPDPIEPPPLRAPDARVEMNPLAAPWNRDLVERGLREAQVGNISLPGEVPAVDLLRAERLRPLAERQAREAMARDGRIAEAGDRVGGGNVSFAADAAAEAIPSALQSRVGEIPVEASPVITPELVTGPDAVLYRRPSVPPTPEEFQRRQRRANVEEGLTIPEIPMEPLSPEVGQFPAEGMPTGTFSNLQRERIMAGQENVRSNVSNNPPSPKPQTISRLESELNVEPGKMKATNKLTQEVGLQVKSIDELNAIEKMYDEATAKGNEAKKNKDFATAMESALKRQLLRETIETATNTGGWTEAAGARKLGERPLDIAKNPEALQWLDKKAEKFGIKYEVPKAEIAPVAEGSTRLYQGSGGPEGAGQGGAYWSSKPDYARNFGPNVEYVDVPTKDLASFDVKSSEGSGTPGTYKLPPEIAKGAKPHPEIKQTVHELEIETGLLDKIDSKLDQIQKDFRNGKTFTGVTGLEPIMIDGALTIARAAVKATKSVKAGIEAAIKYLKEKYPNAKFNPDEFAEFINKNISEASSPASSKLPSRGSGLDDVYKIFEPAPKESSSLKDKAVATIEAVRTGLSSKFRPIDKLAEDIAKAYGTTSQKGIAGIFEQLKGSSGKGEADIYRFDRDVSKLVKGSEKDFNAYLFLRRSLDRLAQDIKDGEGRRAVSDYTIPDLEAKLETLKAKLGPEKLSQFEKAAEGYQSYMDKALKQQVDSGRMSPEVYAAIKSGNQFYAPFKVMKYIEESFKAEGSGAKIDTAAKYTKAMEGIESKDFRLGDMLGAGRQGILLSRILAEKNLAMQKIADLAPYDTEGQFIKKLGEGAEPPKGMEAISVLENGDTVKYAVNKDVAEAVQIYHGNAGGIISRVLSASSGPFRAGATAFNLPFQISNVMADVPRQALVSKYGIKGVSDAVRYPLDFSHAILSSIAGDVFGYKNKLFLDFLDSGVAGTTIQEYLTPQGLRFQEPTNISRSKALAKTVIDVIPDFAQAIEQTSKILGVKRAMRFEGVESGAQLAKQIPAAVTEIRRFSGSPDFGRQGKWTEAARLNLLYMFLNARIQGATADLGRLTGRDGAATAGRTWRNVGIAVGIPTAYLYLLNHSDENAEDYAKRPAQEKQNYWLIPKDDENGNPRYITTEGGEKIRDYWRIPKRETAKWISNMVESTLDFADKKDPKALGKWAQSMMEDISPVNVQGDTAQERLESIGASLNPILKTPLELATGRDMYRHKSIVPEAQKKASPENQYTDRTAQVFKTLAEKMPDVSPEVLRSPLMLENATKNLTAGLFTQFLPRKPIEGRSKTENNPLLQRFQAVPYTDSSEFDDKMNRLERDSADDQLARFRNANKLIEENKGADLRTIAKKMIDQYGADRKLLERVIDLKIAEKVGIDSQERRVLALPVEQRAQFIAGEIANVTPEKKQQLLREYAKKRILSEAVAEELIKLISEKK